MHPASAAKPLGRVGNCFPPSKRLPTHKATSTRCIITSQGRHLSSRTIWLLHLAISRQPRRPGASYSTALPFEPLPVSKTPRRDIVNNTQVKWNGHRKRCARQMEHCHRHAPALCHTATRAKLCHPPCTCATPKLFSRWTPLDMPALGHACVVLAARCNTAPTVPVREFPPSLGTAPSHHARVPTWTHTAGRSVRVRGHR